jgi:hemin uptake protein HemP
VTPPRVDSAALMRGQRVLEIVHLGEVYRLQTTRFGKLILTK